MFHQCNHKLYCSSNVLNKLFHIYIHNVQTGILIMNCEEKQWNLNLVEYYFIVIVFIGMHLKKKTLFLFIKLSILAYVHRITGCYIQVYIPFHSDQSVCCKESHSNSYCCSCGHSRNHRFHSYILGKKDLRYCKLFYLWFTTVCSRKINKNIFTNLFINNIYNWHKQTKFWTKKYKLINISK